MAVFRDVYVDYYDKGLKYEFIAELAPKVWKISRKSDRMEYLAHDVTDILFDIDRKPVEVTDHGHLLRPDGQNLLQQVEMILNHPNLVSLVDSFPLQFSTTARLGHDKWFMVWDYCDAGNLGNLLVPSQPRPQDLFPKPKPKPTTDDGDIEMNDLSPSSNERPKFLPESFCWHVLTSILRALTWLHDGVMDVVQNDDGEWERHYEHLDWQPMLHRDINPDNIFLGYPRRREWYGPVKLGNYGRLFISGHCQTAGDKHEPTYSKVMGPPPDFTFVRLEDMVATDAKYGSVYPPGPDQPYTMVSEYRALGEIMQAMMVVPTRDAHMITIRSRSVVDNLENTEYTACLKNFIVKLMQFDPWYEPAEQGQPNPTYVTSDLYREALEGVERFLGNGSAEAKAYVTAQMAEREDYFERTALRAKDLLGSYKNVQEILEQFTKA
ncbi:hypothetical protein GGR50DRAFT_694820 [Xylaria sp. CBS 124048]|nr:hypothetical protein GGR50DRAFT_694820 [Xylaria sp. CBS 124048]